MRTLATLLQLFCSVAAASDFLDCFNQRIDYQGSILHSTYLEIGYLQRQIDEAQYEYQRVPLRAQQDDLRNFVRTGGPWYQAMSALYFVRYNITNCDRLGRRIDVLAQDKYTSEVVIADMDELLRQQPTISTWEGIREEKEQLEQHVIDLGYQLSELRTLKAICCGS